MADPVQNFPSISKLSMESDRIDSTTPPVDPTHLGGYKNIGLEETASTKISSQDKESSMVETTPSANATTIDEPLTLQDSPIPLNLLEVPRELETEAVEKLPQKLAEMADIDKQAESSALDADSLQVSGTNVYINEEALHVKEAEAAKGQPVQTENSLPAPSKLHLTVSKNPGLQDGAEDKQVKDSHQENASTRPSRPSPVQIQSHLLTSPDDPLTSSPTASNPNTPDSQDQMVNVQDDVVVDESNVDVGSSKDQNEVEMRVVTDLPVNDEALPNPFEFLPPVSLPWYDPTPPSPRSTGSLPNRRDARVQRLPSVLRPANRHHFDTEGSRRASMVAGWDFTPPVFPSTPPLSPGGQYSPRDRRISLEGVGLRQEPYRLPLRPQSSASWYPQFHRVNSQPVYVDTINNGYGYNNNHQRLSSQPSYFSGGSNSFPDLHRSNTSEMGYFAYPRQNTAQWDREPEREQNDYEPYEPSASETVPAIPPVNESDTEPAPVIETANEQGNESNVTETDDDMTKPPCPEQSSKGRWKFWSRNKQSAPCSNDQAEMTSSSPSNAASRTKVKKRLSRTLLKRPR